MRVAKLILISVGVLLVLQAGTWATIGSRRSSAIAVDATRHVFELAQHHAVRNGWDVDGRLPSQSFVVSEALAETLGQETFDDLVSQSRQFNVELRVGDGPDQLVIYSAHNNPLFATVEVGHVGRGCESVAPIDYFHVVGLWIRLPDGASYWIRDRVEDVERFKKAWQPSGDASGIATG